MSEPTFDQQLQAARDPATPGGVLEEIAAKYIILGYVLVGLDGGPRVEPEADPRRIWEALAGNPSTPPRLLARLAPRLPAEFCANPAASFLTLEVPEFASWLDEEGDRSAGHIVSDLLRLPEVPGSLVAALTKQSQDKALREEASLHIALAGEAPERGDAWLTEVRRTLRTQARALRGAYRQHLFDLIEASIAPDWLVEASALAEPPPPPEAVGKWGIKARNPAAADPDAPAEKLLTLAEQRHRGNDMALIQNPATPAQALLTILDNWQEETPGRALAALRADLPPVVVAKLVEQKDPVVNRTLRRRGYGSGDDGLSLRLRREAAQAALRGAGGYSPVLSFLALANLPPEFDAGGQAAMHLEQAMGRRYWQMRMAVPFHPRLNELLPNTGECLAVLAEDGNRLVRAAARARLRGEDIRL